MASDDDKTVIVCSPAALGEAAVPESIMVPCVDCSQPAWVSPSSFEILAEGADVLCMLCLEKRIAANPDEPLEIRQNPKFEAARAAEIGNHYGGAVGEREQVLIDWFPMVPWLQPQRVIVADRDEPVERLTCRLCTATRGLRARDLEGVGFATPEEFQRHLEKEHGALL